MVRTEQIQVQTQGNCHVVDITRQQIILVDFDTRSRSRTVICQIVGE